MSFPRPIPLSEDIIRARKARGRALVLTARFGVFIRLFIVAFEFLGFYLYSSSSLLYDGLSTLFDVMSSVLLILSIRLAERPPDTNHPFGHGRYEPLCGMQLGVFLAIGGFGLFLQQLHALYYLEKSQYIDAQTWLFPFVVIILLELTYRKIMATAKKEQSPALLSEAIHFRVDSLNSLFALIALGLAALIPGYAWLFDRMGALVISLFMCVMGFFAAKKNLNQILDRIPEKEWFSKVKQAAIDVPGVLDTEKIRIQLYGPSAHIDIDVEVDPQLSVEEGHKISQKVRIAIQKAWPQVQDVVVHLEPYYPGDHIVS